MANPNTVLTSIAADSTQNKADKKRYLELNEIKNATKRKLTLRFHDTKHTWCNIPLGEVIPEKKDSITKDQHVLVPVLPLLFTTPECNKDDYQDIQEGWLYIFRDGFLWRELQVLKKGKMRDVNLRYWQGHNKRQATSELDTRVIIPFKIAGLEQKIEAAYSEVQWSWYAICSLGGMSTKDPRYRQDIHNGSEVGIDFSKITKDQDFYSKRLVSVKLADHQNNFESEVSGSKLVAHVGNVNKLKKHPKVPPKIRLDYTSELAAVILYDPVGIAHTLTAKLGTNWDELMATMASLETGIKPGSKQVVIPYEAEDIKAQFTIASYMYQIGFGNDEGKDQYGDDLSKARLETILGVNERKIIRDKIKDARKFLIKHLKSNEYQVAMTDYTRNIHERLIDGKAIVALHNEHVATHPHEKDFHFDIPDNIEKDLHEEDEGWQYLRTSLNVQNDTGALLVVTLDKQKMGITGKVDAIVAKILEGFKKLIIKDVEMLKKSTVIINSFNAVGAPEVTVTKVDLRPQIPEGYQTVPGATRTEIVEQVGNKKTTTTVDSPDAAAALDGAGKKSASGVARVEFGEATIRIYPEGTNIGKAAEKFDVSIQSTKTIHQIVEKENSTYRFLKGIEHTKMYRYGFKGILGIVEIINLGSAISEMKQKGLNLRELANVTGAIAGTLNFALGMKKLHLAALGGRLSQSATHAINFTGRVAPILGITVSSIDSYNRFKVNDYDAAAWHAAAAVSGIVLLVITSTGLIILPIALIAFGIFAAIMGVMAEDDLLETYAKHGHFRSEVTKIAGKDLWAKIKNQASNPVYSDKFKKWKSLKVAENDLVSYLNGNKVYFGAKFIKDDKAIATNGKKITVIRPSFLRARVSFKRFELVSSQLDYRMRVYPKGLDGEYKKGKKYIEIRPNETKYKTDKKYGGIESITLSFKLDKKLINELSEESDLLFMCRQLVNVSTGNYVPTNDAGGEFRYYAVRRPGTKGYKTRIDTYSGQVSEESDDYRKDFGKHCVVGTIDEIERRDFWKKI